MESWVQEEDGETLDTLPKRWSAGLFRHTSASNKNPTVNKQMHVYVTRMSPWLTGIPAFHYIIMVFLTFLYIIGGPLGIALEFVGLFLITLASIRLSGFYSGKYTENIEHPEWRENAAAMESAHSGFIFLQWGTINLVMATLVQWNGVTAPAVLIILFFMPIWGIWKLQKFSADVELPQIEEKKRDGRYPTWRSRPLN